MPDQSSAADEHAIMQEITAPLSSLPDDPVPIAADIDFPVVLRGYDRIAVDAYVKKTSQLVAELQATRSPEAAIRRALERVGEEVSGILQRAHETAAQITAQSRSEAEDRLDAARKEAAAITSGAENRLKDLDAETDRIWAERQRIVEDTRELARQLLALSDAAVERFPAAEDTGSGEVVALQSGGDAGEGAALFDQDGPARRASEAEGEAPADKQPEGSVDAPGTPAAGEEAGTAAGEEGGPRAGEERGPGAGEEAEMAAGEEADYDDTDVTMVMPPVPPPEERDRPR